MKLAHEIRRALWTAGALIGAALSLKWMSSRGWIDGDTSQRLIQVAIGVVLILTANLVPKQLRKLSDDGCDPSREQSRRRFAGWAFVIAGIAYAVIWLVVPIDRAVIVSVCVLGGTMLLVFVPCVRLLLRRGEGMSTRK